MEERKSIKAHYIKTQAYRSYFADGFIGGLSPGGKLYIEFFLQRAVTPRSIEYAIDERGLMGEEMGREGKEGMVRQIESGLMLDIDVARALQSWLKQKIEEYEKSTVMQELKKLKNV